MRKVYLIICLLFAGLTVNANHQIGMDIRYEYTGTGNVYRVFVNYYADCGGAGIVPTYTETVTFTSSCGSFYRILSHSADTVTSMWCPGTSISCGSYGYVLVARFSDTVTLAPCSNWKMSCDDGSRNPILLNLGTSQGSTSQYNYYVEAFLNNSTAPNSSSAFDNDPQYFSGVNSLVSEPFHATDIEGDSILTKLVRPYTVGNQPIPYYTAGGFDTLHPLGNGSICQLNSSNSTLQTFVSSVGRYCLAARVYDYRNGILVGYSSRDWQHTVINAGNPKAPLPISGSNLTTTTCPGQYNTYTVNFMDSVSTDSVYLTLTPPNNGIIYSTTYSPGIGAGSATITWTTPPTYNVSANPYYFIKVFARDNQCVLNGNASYNILVKVAQCNTDTVWAGDANADHIVNMYDPLFVALANGSTGAARAGASTAWAPQWCANWGTSFNTGVNYKHADCNGNGTVDNADLSAITANYGQYHSREDYKQLAKEAGVPDLYFDHNGINIYPGATITIPVKLGSSSSMANLLGLASRIRITGIAPGSPTVTSPVSWLGTSANTLSFSKITGTNSIDWAYARTNHQNNPGQGTIAALTFTVPTGTAIGQKVVLTFNSTKLISQTGSEIPGFNVLSDTFTVQSLGVGNIVSPISNAVVIPNPSKGAAVLQVSLSQLSPLNIAVTDITGRIVWQSGMSGMHTGVVEVALPKTLRSGVYMVQLNTGNASQVVKWVCE